MPQVIMLLLILLAHIPLVAVSRNKTRKVVIKPFEQLIKDYILDGYDEHLRPVMNASSNLKVRLNPALYTISDVNFAKQTMTIKVWIRMNWTDERLTWNPEDFGGVKELMFERSRVWTPDIYILDQTEIKYFLADSQTAVVLQSNGAIFTSVDQVATVHCSFDVSNFPYDVQTCRFRISSWMYSIDQLDPYPRYWTDLYPYRENNEWVLLNFSASCADTPVMTTYNVSYVDVWYNVAIARKPQYYLWTFIFPSFLVTCLSIIGIFSPSHADGGREQKVDIGLTALLSMVVILIMVTDQMPKSTNGYPLLGIFIMMEISLGALAIAASVGVMYLHCKWLNGAPVPGALGLIACSGRKYYRKRKVSIGTSTVSLVSVKDVDDRCDTPGSSSSHWARRVAKREELTAQNESLYREWSRVTQRLDIVLMIVFLLLNLGILIAVLMQGTTYTERHWRNITMAVYDAQDREDCLYQRGVLEGRA